MTLKEIRDNVLRVLWLENQDTVPSYIWEDVATAINSALQLMHQSPLDYFRKEEIEVTFLATESEKNLYDEASVQEVIGPVWIVAEDNRELHRITDESEFNQFFQRFFGMTEAEAVTSGIPTPSYYMVRTRRSYSEGNASDSSACFLAIKPPPAEDVTLKLLVAKSAESLTTFEVINLTGAESTPVPANNVETILLPLARWYAMRSHFFFEKDKIDMINADAQRAMMSLQVTDPEIGTQSHIAEQMRKKDSKTNQDN